MNVAKLGEGGFANTRCGEMAFAQSSLSAPVQKGLNSIQALERGVPTRQLAKQCLVSRWRRPKRVRG